ncbi:hypothetical protein J2D73_20105 [Acetobacter sacchari]|uniref:Uncharacterized protein n=1 Tax=Acetobacter sacchari TaxID=2661687 RepID=A0ABS3M1R6_9PROT|nr:hypothetical protein [Acetobacter sacchari]MBO1362084.1 hypothetical protein [Acetobacter sacchari]
MGKKLKSLGVFTLDHPGPWVTRDGQPVEVKFTDGRDYYQVKGYIGDRENLSSWTEEGSFTSPPEVNEEDLFNAEYVKETREFWVNEYPWGFGGSMGTKTREESVARVSENCLGQVLFREVLPGDDA